MRSTDTDDQSFTRKGDRIFSLKGAWYFQTREYDHGPFPTRAEAQNELDRYVCDMRYVNAANCNPAYLFGESRSAPSRSNELRRITPQG
ncbi:MAG: DUF6316 family protein [Pseudomonadales bacterium]